MFVRLKEKPFYFLTDRETKYTYFVDNRGTEPQKHLYYPEQFETMSGSQIRSYKWKMVNQLMRWSLFNSEQMTVTDRKICASKILDLGFTLLTGLLMGSFMRRALFRIEMPFFDMAFQRGIFNSRWLKSVAAYTVAGIVIYNAMNPIMKQQYLVDLAFEYKYNFNKDLRSLEVEHILDELCQQRFDGGSDGKDASSKEK